MSADEHDRAPGDGGDAAAEPGGEAHGGEAVAEEYLEYAEGSERELPHPGSGPEQEGSGPATGGEPSAPDEDELQRALRERSEYLDLAQRSRAELENYRKRMSGEAANAEHRGRVSVAKELLGAVDNLERALLAAGVDPDGTVPDEEPASAEVSAHTALAEGVALVYRELCSGLKRAGVESFDPSGERFDPACHEAVSTSSADGVERGRILETLEKGYRLGDQVLRPARVIVSG